ncbi:hypothetical protein HZA38_03180 [Candidatus Peregrinibacteria bacterium]|nr:hypothetical protein [Candidatus Peregrinibacteria bacterium]
MILFTGFHSAYADFSEEDLYKKIYEKFQFAPTETAITRVSGQMGMKKESVERILTTNPLELTIEGDLSQITKIPFCQSNRSEDILGRCLMEFQDLFKSVRSLAEYEVVLKEEISSGDRWTNGTLIDGSFDIIVDLNVIDVILFGPRAKAPQPRLPGSIIDGNETKLVDPLVQPFPPPDGPGSGDNRDGNGGGNNGNENNGDGNDNGSDDGNNNENDGSDNNDNDTTNPPDTTDDQNTFPDENSNTQNGEYGMCKDPDALYFGGDNTSSSNTPTPKEKTDDTSSQENTNTENGEKKDEKKSDENTQKKNDSQNGETRKNSGGAKNVSDPQKELPDLSGGNDDFDRGTYPDLDGIDSGGGCAGDEVDLFYGLLCIPKFCKDLICVNMYLTTKPAFSLAEQETPACIECIIERGYEILESMADVVEAPKSASTVGYSLSSFLSITKNLGIEFYLLPRALPFLNYNDPSKENSSKEIAKGMENDATGKPTPSEKSEKIAPENLPAPQEELLAEKEDGSSESTEPGADSPNYQLLKKMLKNDCKFVFQYFPGRADVSTSQLLSLCDDYMGSKKKEAWEQVVLTEAALPSDAQKKIDVDLQKEFFTNISASLERFREDVKSMTAVVLQMHPEKIDTSNTQCKKNLK